MFYLLLITDPPALPGSPYSEIFIIRFISHCMSAAVRKHALEQHRIWNQHPPRELVP